MRTTVDIPDALHRELKSKAALEGTSVKELILRGVVITLKSEPEAAARKRPRQQVIKTGNPPGSLKLTNAQIYDILFS